VTEKSAQPASTGRSKGGLAASAPDASKADASKATASKAVASKAAASGLDATKAVASKADASKADASKAAASRAVAFGLDEDRAVARKVTAVAPKTKSMQPTWTGKSDESAATEAPAETSAAPSQDTTAPVQSSTAAGQPLPRWEVIGGKDTGGIFVRMGPELASKPCGSRLAHNSVVEELATTGDRIQYRLLRGGGPATGWLSMKIKVHDESGHTVEKPLVQRKAVEVLPLDVESEPSQPVVGVPTSGASGGNQDTSSAPPASEPGIRPSVVELVPEESGLRRVGRPNPSDWFPKKDIKVSGIDAGYCQIVDMYGLGKISIRELPLADGVHASTGCQLWPASLALGKFVLSEPELSDGKSCIELGAGCGFASVCAALLCNSVIVTDYDLETVGNLSFNLDVNYGFWGKGIVAGETRTNELHDTMRAEQLQWDNVQQHGWPLERRADIVMGSDIIYGNWGALVVQVAVRLLKPGGLIVILSAEDRGGLDDLEIELVQAGFDLELRHWRNDGQQFLLYTARDSRTDDHSAAKPGVFRCDFKKLKEPSRQPP